MKQKSIAHFHQRPRWVLLVALALCAASCAEPTSEPSALATINAANPTHADAPKGTTTIHTGPKGVTFENVDVDEAQAWGSGVVALHGKDVFITDPVADRIVQLDARGQFIQSIPLNGEVLSVFALEVTDSAILALGPTEGDAAVLQINRATGERTSFLLPPHLSLGANGLKTDDSGTLLEQYGGATLTRIFDSKGQPVEEPADGYLFNDQHFSVRPPDLSKSTEPHLGYVRAGKRDIQIEVDNLLAGLRLLEVRDDGSLSVLVEEMVMTPTIQVDQTVRHFDADGHLIGQQRLPLDQQFVPISTPAVVINGDVTAVLSTPQGLILQPLSAADELEPILSSPTFSNVTPEVTIQSHNFPAQIFNATTCLLRSQMMSTAAAYVNNSRALTTANLTGACSGRTRPRYLGTTAATYSSIPYDWGGFASVSEFNSKMASGSQAGDINTAGVEACSVGVDCSGFVSRVWNQISKYGTSTLSQISTALSSTQSLMRGDILNLSGSHVVLFESAITNGLKVYEATVFNNVDRVVYWSQAWSRFNGYTPRRFNNACTDTTPPSITAISPSNNAILRRGTSYTISWSATDPVGLASVAVGLISGSATTCYGTSAIVNIFSGSYRTSVTWTVPTTLSTGTYKFKYAAADAEGNWGCVVRTITIQ